jgi:hypothetical protein
MIRRTSSVAAFIACSFLASCDDPARGESVDAAGGSSGTSGGAAGDASAGGEAAGAPPTRLSQTGLYSDLTASEDLAPGVLEYRPRFELWSDGAEKRRFVSLPPDATIDTSDMNYWVFPVGTRVWKEFTSQGVRVETRMLEKTGAESWLMLAFAWEADRSDALVVPRGSDDALGTEHDVPSTVMCRECHDDVPDKLLGFAAVQLSHSLGGVTLEDLVREGRLSHPPDGPIELPGDPVAQSALGYLHANCGNCHNPRSGDFPTVHLELWLDVETLATVEETTTFRTTVRVPFEGVPPNPDIASVRIAPGDPEGSALYQRMGAREPLVQMPPLASERTDENGLRDVAAWILALPP